MATETVDGRARRRGGLFTRLWGERRGVAAVEFGLLAPLLIGIYVISMEVSQAVETSKKLSRANAMTGDIVAQLSEVTKSEVDAIMKIGGAILQPYGRSKPTIAVTGIRITTDNPPKVLVSWSRKLTNGSFGAGAAKDSPTTVPPKLTIPGSFLVRVESRLSYSPVLTGADPNSKSLGMSSAFHKVGMGENNYFRPRMTDTIKCSDC